MIKRILLQASLSLIAFFGSWWLLSQVEWTEMLEVEEHSNTLEETLGDILINDLESEYEVIEDQELLSVLDSIVDRLAEDNDFDASSIKVHLVQSEMVNAFAFPDNHLVIHSGLVAQMQQQEELMGVMAHEVAHIRNNHVMQRLIREFGLGVLTGMITGNGPDVIQQVSRVLSSRAFDREQEEEADREAVAMMNACGISGEHLANFLYILADYSGEGSQVEAWLSTHPELKSRALKVLEWNEADLEVRPAPLSETAWNGFYRELSGGEEPSAGEDIASEDPAEQDH